MIIIKPIIFNTQSNNKYFYDDASSFIFPLLNNDEEKELTNINSIKYLTDLKSKRLIELQNKYHLFMRDETQVINPEEFINSRIKKGCRQLIIELTQSCNFRCKYCVFSECYSEMRTFTNKKAEWNIIKKAIDYYMNYNLDCQKYNPTLTPAITFYGGEPLLEFNLLKKSIEYINSTYAKSFSKIDYALTTNGYLLNDEIINFLLVNKVFITISFDGNEKTHNRNRVLSNDKGTFAKVYDNFKKFAETADLYSIRYIFNTVIDCKEDIRNILSFFDQDPVLRKAFGKFSFVDAYHSSYYEGLNYPDLVKQRINELFQIIEENNSLSDLARNMLKQIFNLFEAKINYDQKILLNSCAIGIDKLMVDVHGNFYACEKTNTNYCLGNVNDGINKEKVIRYFEFLKDIQQNRCNYCPIRNLCDVCIKTVDVNNDEFNIKKERCDETVIRFTSLLKLYCYSKEKGYF